MYAYTSLLEVAAAFIFGVKHLDIDGGLCQNFLIMIEMQSGEHSSMAHMTAESVSIPRDYLSRDCGLQACLLYQVSPTVLQQHDLDRQHERYKVAAFDCGDRRGRRVTLITPRELLRIPIERPAVHRYVNSNRK